MAKSNQDYWGKRLDEIAQRRFDTTNDKMQEELKKMYEEVSAKMQEDVETLYYKMLEDDLTRTEIWTYKHYRDLEKQINKEMVSLGNKEVKLINRNLEIALEEIYKETNILPDANMFAVLDKQVAKAIIARTWAPQHFTSTTWKNKEALAKQLKKGITECIVTGRSKDKLVTDVMNRMNSGFNDADRVVRTELMHTINQGQIQRYKDSGYAKLEILVAEDERTCDFCNRHNGEIIPIDSKEIPPFHPRCRCSTIPVLDSKKSVENNDNNDIIKQQIEKMPKNVHSGRQDKHRIGNNEFNQKAAALKKKNQYGPSYTTISDSEIEILVTKYAGSGIPIIDKYGVWASREVILNNDTVVGKVVNNLTGKTVDTTVFKIHYSNEGVHIVPDYPSKKKGSAK